MIRLFTALEIPDDVAAPLTRCQSGLRNTRWVARENFHITVRYIGEVDEPTASDIDEALAELKLRAFDVQVEGLGAFGHKHDQRAVWAGIAPNEALMALNAKVERVLQESGLAPDKRKYAPHVTLGRLRNTSDRDVADWIGANGSYVAPPFTATRVTLFSSQVRHDGSLYLPERYYIF